MSTRQLRYEIVGDGSDEGNSSHWSFYFARGIGSQASVGAAVDDSEDRWAGKTHLPASLVLAQSEQFEASKSVSCEWGIRRTVYLIFCVILPGFLI